MEDGFCLDLMKKKKESKASLLIVFCISMFPTLNFKYLKNFCNLTPRTHDYQLTSVIFKKIDTENCIFFEKNRSGTGRRCDFV